MFFLCFQAIYLFRRFWYEIFLAIHVVLAIVFMVACWHHVGPQRSGHMEWLYAAVAVWVFDRALRFGRLFLLNISWSKGRVARTAHLQCIGPDTIKAHVNVGYNFNGHPGQYVYLHFPRFNFWESHPFSVARYDISKDTVAQPTLTLLFRTHDGVTKKLAKYLAGGSKTLTCFVEGPYGHQLPVDRYDNVHLLAGGVGIAAIVPYLRTLSAIKGSRVRFDWVVRQEDSLKWFEEEISECTRNPHVDVHVHVTQRPDTPTDTISNGEAKGSHEGSTENGKIDEIGIFMDRNSGDIELTKCVVECGRPCLTKLITGHVAEMVGSLAVVACGPGTFVDEIRRAVVDNVVGANGTLDYFEESFTW
jgi:predicted ferric reductase